MVLMMYRLRNIIVNHMLIDKYDYNTKYLTMMSCQCKEAAVWKYREKSTLLTKMTE